MLFTNMKMGKTWIRSVPRGPFIKGFEVYDNFAVDVGVKLGDLALPEEVQLIFTYRKWS